MTHPSPETLRRLKTCDILGNVEAFIGSIEDGTQAKHYGRLLEAVYQRDCGLLHLMAREDWSWGAPPRTLAA